MKNIVTMNELGEQARGEGNCARATERGEEACECMGKYRVCRLPSVRHSPLDCTLTETARLRTETSYKAGTVRRVTIDKPDGGKRLLGIPNVVDRLIQQAIVQILTPISLHVSSKKILADSAEVLGIYHEKLESHEINADQ